MDASAQPPVQELDCKVVLVGDTKCGKTSLIQRFVSDKFNEVYTPTGFQMYSVTYDVGDVRMSFAIWDTAGSVAYDSVRPLAYQDAHVFLLCFSVADPASLDNTVNKWYPEVMAHSLNAAVILCGCQVDLRTDKEALSQMTLVKSPVTPEMAVNVSRQVGATTYVETSAKWSSKAVCDAFEIAALAALGRLNKNTCLAGDRLRPAPRSKSKVDLKSELKDRAKSCTVM